MLRLRHRDPLFRITAVVLRYSVNGCVEHNVAAMINIIVWLLTLGGVVSTGRLNGYSRLIAKSKKVGSVERYASECSRYWGYA